MSATDKAEQLVVEGLCPHANAVDRRFCYAFQPFGSHVIGICLNGNLCILFYREVAANRAKKLFQQLGRQQTRCSAPYIYSMYARTFYILSVPKLLFQRLHVRSHYVMAVSGGVEIAIEASLLAERKVDVE